MKLPGSVLKLFPCQVRATDRLLIGSQEGNPNPAASLVPADRATVKLLFATSEPSPSIAKLLAPPCRVRIEPTVKVADRPYVAGVAPPPKLIKSWLALACGLIVTFVADKVRNWPKLAEKLPTVTRKLLNVMLVGSAKGCARSILKLRLN